MPNRYTAAHQNAGGPGDARPTALGIVQDEGLEGKLADKVIFITGCSSGLGTELCWTGMGLVRAESLR